MKVDRYKICPCQCYTSLEIVIDPEGSVCYTRDVEKLEAKCAELEAMNAELLEALEGLSKKAAQHFWRDTVVIRARAAIAKAKGEGV